MGRGKLRPMHTILSVLLSLGVVCAAQGSEKKQTELSGTWVLITAGGQDIPTRYHKALRFAGTNYEKFTSGKVDETGTFKVDASTRPMAIDLVIATGEYAGKTQLGIGEVSDDRLTLTLAEPGEARPTAAQTANQLVLWRVKPIAKEFEGSWEGAIDDEGRLVRVVISLTNGADGLPSGILVNLDESISNQPMLGVVQHGSRLRLVVPGVRGGYDGELKADQITGTWTLGPFSVPLVLKRKPAR